MSGEQLLLAVDAAAASGALTHAHANSRDAVRLHTAIIWELLHGAKKEEVLSPSFKNRHPELWEKHKFYSGSFNILALLENPGSASFPQGEPNGPAIAALQVALEAFRLTDNFMDGFLHCVRKVMTLIQLQQLTVR